MRIYQELPNLSKEEALSKLASSNRDELCLLLLGLADLQDLTWIEDVYLQSLNNEDDWVASAAITGLGHLARIHRNIDKKRVINLLRELAINRPKLSGKVEDTLDDIEMFT